MAFIAIFPANSMFFLLSAACGLLPEPYFHPFIPPPTPLPPRRSLWRPMRTLMRWPDSGEGPVEEAEGGRPVAGDRTPWKPKSHPRATEGGSF